MGMTGDARHEPVQGQQERCPEDYHDYVFRDGKFVGDFDNMYRYAKGIPWEQDKRCEHWYTEVGMLIMKRFWKSDAGLGLSRRS